MSRSRTAVRRPLQATRAWASHPGGVKRWGKTSTIAPLTISRRSTSSIRASRNATVSAWRGRGVLAHIQRLRPRPGRRAASGPSRSSRATSAGRLTVLDFTRNFIALAAMLAQRSGSPARSPYRQGDALVSFADSGFDVRVVTNAP